MAFSGMGFQVSSTGNVRPPSFMYAFERHQQHPIFTHFSVYEDAGKSLTQFVGLGCTYPGAAQVSGVAGFMQSATSAADLPTLIPFERWDAERHYSPRPEGVALRPTSPNFNSNTDSPHTHTTPTHTRSHTCAHTRMRWRICTRDCCDDSFFVCWRNGQDLLTCLPPKSSPCCIKCLLNNPLVMT